MITREKFDSIKKKYSRVASWAIWAHEDEEPKSNMGDLTVLDPEINKNLLSELNPNVVLVGLNFSETNFSKLLIAYFLDLCVDAGSVLIRCSYDSYDLVFVRKLAITIPLANLVYYPNRFYWFYGC